MRGGHVVFKLCSAGPLDVDHDFARVAIISRVLVRNYPLG